MYSLIVLLLFAGTYLMYCSSKKMKCYHQIEKSFLKQLSPPMLKVSGLLLMIISAVLTIMKQGYEAGALAFMVYLMAALSIVNLLIPYRILDWKHVLILFCISFTMEILI